MPTIVSNSTPLIHLARIGQLGLLRDFFGNVMIPPAVYDECVVQGKAYRDALLIAQADWLETKEVSDGNLVILLNAELDRGESEAIALALQQEADLLLLDDSEGRHKARLYGLKYTGTVGILLKAKHSGKLPLLRSALDDLQDTGFWLDSRLYQKLLQEAGE
jgi:predicted nucleic acid-binding protein